MDATRLLDTREVARRAGCSPANIRRLRLAGHMPAAQQDKVGQTWVWTEAAIMAWLPNRPRQGQRAKAS